MKPVLATLLIVTLSSPLSVLAADLNQATRAEIEAVRGVGVELAERILAARQDGPFRHWEDLRRRVRGVGIRTLTGFAEAGWQIAGQAPPAPTTSATPATTPASAERSVGSAR